MAGKKNSSNLPRGPSSGGEISAYVIWGKNMKREEKKGQNAREKGSKREKEGKKEKEKYEVEG
jgi:hypothetical protein